MIEEKYLYEKEVVSKNKSKLSTLFEKHGSLFGVTGAYMFSFGLNYLGYKLGMYAAENGIKTLYSVSSVLMKTGLSGVVITTISTMVLLDDYLKKKIKTGFGRKEDACKGSVLMK